MSFVFIPRSVSKANKGGAQHPTSNHRTTPYSPQNQVADHHTTVPAPDSKGKAKARSTELQYHDVGTGLKLKLLDEDYSNLLCLALSDHALWFDPDLRRNIEWYNKGEADGFVPLLYLLKSSKILAPLRLGDAEASIAKALRNTTSDVLDIRLLVSRPSSSAWFGGSDNIDNLGGYEIRRKDWENAHTHLSKAQWEERTLYLENIPVQYRTIPGIARFVLALLSEHSDSKILRTRIQNIVLLQHHQDKPGDQPTCKGFAIVAFATTSDVEYILKAWAWDRNTNLKRTPRTDTSMGLAEAQEAKKFGFRTLSKVRWEQLKAEYTAYHKRLVEEINTYNDSQTLVAVPPESARVPRPEPVPPPLEMARTEEYSLPTISPSSPYPTNSLVFVKNIHTETNKTTLRKLFARAFEEPLTTGEIKNDGLDYVDFNKGMDSCHLRLSTPRHAKILVEYFSKHSLSQSQGLADIATPVDAQNKAIAIELVLGKREELYWNKVPEKIRRQAVQKAIDLINSPLTIDANTGMDVVSEGNARGETRKRKRRSYNY